MDSTKHIRTPGEYSLGGPTAQDHCSTLTSHYGFWLRRSSDEHPMLPYTVEELCSLIDTINELNRNNPDQWNRLDGSASRALDEVTVATKDQLAALLVSDNSLIRELAKRKKLTKEVIEKENNDRKK